MTDAAFLASIIVNPDNDEPRLVYADWLTEEAGQPERGEFIRVQIELANQRMAGMPVVPPSNGDPDEALKKYEALRRRERELAMLLGFGPNVTDRRWYPEWSNSDYDYYRVDIRRGFIESITCTWQDWLAHHAAIRAATPLREVTLTEWTDDDLIAHDFKVIVKNGKPTWTSDRFPGIKFEFGRDFRYSRSSSSLVETFATFVTHGS